MKTRRFLFLMSVIFFCVLLAKCGKNGAVGPQGPAGATGATGATGAKGATGNANVKVDTFTVKSADWSNPIVYYSFATGNGSLSFLSLVYNRANTSITSGIINTGAILVYFEPAQAIYNERVLLPYSYSSFNGAYNYNYAYTPSAGNVELYFFFTPNYGGALPDITTYKMPDLHFKVITISGTIIGAIRQNHINLNDPKAVSQFLGLK